MSGRGGVSVVLGALGGHPLLRHAASSAPQHREGAAPRDPSCVRRDAGEAREGRPRVRGADILMWVCAWEAK